MNNPFMRAVLTVKEKIQLTPHYIRIILEGDEIDVFAHAKVGDNNKIILPVNGVVNLPEGRDGMDRSRVRTYTLRALDLEKGEMVVDFVAHGDEGPASGWAISAQKGDQLGVLMKAKNNTLFETASNYFFMGDHTALPVISVMLESLPDHVKGKVILEVRDEHDMLSLQKPADVEIIWTYNNQPGKQELLSSHLSAEDLPSDIFFFAAAEYQSIRAIREKVSQANLERSQWRAYSYWRYGESEDGSAQQRSQIAHRG